MKEKIIEELATLIRHALMEHKSVDIPSLGLFEVKHNDDQHMITVEGNKVISIPEDRIIFNPYPTDGIR